MSWSLVWTFVAEHRDLRRLHWRSATDLIGALMHFAKTGRGALAVPGEPALRRVRAGGSEALVRIDPGERVVLVLRLYRAH